MASDDLLRRRSLQRRIDTKYLVSADTLESLFANHFNQYRVVVDSGLRVQQYKTRYFDEASLTCFENDKRNIIPRHKIRIREYLDRDISFFEIKSRNDDRTKKRRYEYSKTKKYLGDHEQTLISKYTDLDPQKLQCEVKTFFNRMTLLGLSRNERITVDTDLVFEHRGKSTHWSDIAVVEVKQPYEKLSVISKSIKLAGYKRADFSKYKTAIEKLSDLDGAYSAAI